MAGQRFQRAHLDQLLPFRARAEFYAEQAEQRGEDALDLVPAEFGSLVEIGVLDHLQQNIVRGNQARLAFDHHREAETSRARGELAIDQLQFAGIDVELGVVAVYFGSGLCQPARRHSRRAAAAAIVSFRRQHSPTRSTTLNPAGPSGWRTSGLALAYRLVIVKHRPQLPFEPLHASAEGYSSIRHTRRRPMRQLRNREKLTILIEGLFTKKANKAFKRGRIESLRHGPCPDISIAPLPQARSSRGRAQPQMPWPLGDVVAKN